MYLDYFDKFLNMDPYLFIDEREWDYIKQTFEKQDVRESLAKVAMTYPLPYMDITENDAYKELQKLKGMRHNETNIKRLQSDVERLIEQIEKLKDKVRSNGG